MLTNNHAMLQEMDLLGKAHVGRLSCDIVDNGEHYLKTLIGD